MNLQVQSLTLASLPISKHSWRFSLSLLDAVMGLMGNKQQTSKNILFSTKNRSKKIIYEVRKLEHIEITKREDHIEMQECTTTARLTDRQAGRVLY